MMINGTVVKHWSRTQATRAVSTEEAEYYAVVTGAAEGPGMQSTMADLGLSTQVRVLDGLQRCQSDCVETGSWKDPTRGTEVCVVAGGNQFTESEDEANPRRAKLGRPPGEREAMARDRSTDPRSRRTHENESEQQGERRREEVASKMKPVWLRTSRGMQQCSDGLVRGVH